MKMWCVTISASLFPFFSRMFESSLAGPSLLELVNRREINIHWDLVDHDMADHEVWERAAMKFRGGPAEIIRIAEPSFDVDYFFIRNDYASAALRAVFALRPDEIAYRQIDTSQLNPSARAMRYEAFLPLKVANPFDPVRMRGSIRSVRQEDGSSRNEWVLDPPPPTQGVPEAMPVYFRPDFEPPAPLFRAMGFLGSVFATEELADRVTRAGMTGIGFRDVEGDRAGREMIYRNPG